MVERHGDLEIRRLPDGRLDEIVMYDKDDKCIFHLEKMNERTFWMRFYGSEKDVVVWTNEGDATAEWDEKT